MPGLRAASKTKGGLAAALFIARMYRSGSVESGPNPSCRFRHESGKRGLHLRRRGLGLREHLVTINRSVEVVFGRRHIIPFAIVRGDGPRKTLRGHLLM